MTVRDSSKRNISVRPLDSTGAAGSTLKKFYAVDALQKRSLTHLKAFKAWAGDTPIFIGEFGVPKADASYLENERLFLEALNALGIPAAYWATGQYWGNYNLNAYEFNGTDIIDNPIAQYLENNETSLRGVNIAGAEFGISPGVNGYHNTNLGVKNSNYFWPSTAYLGKVIDRGHKLVRLPFTWERLQPTLGGVLDITYLADLKTTVDYLRGRNVTVLLDVHNYGAYRTAAGIFKIGSATVTQAHFNDLWTRINTEFSTYGNIWYGLMNEPANLTFAEWETVSQSTVTALRAAGATQKIVVALGNYSGIAQVSSHTTGPWITGGGDIMYEGHSYHDADYSGDYSETYAASNTTASGQGHTAGFIDVGLDSVRADTIIGNSVKFTNKAGTQLADLEADGDFNIKGGYYINGAKITDASSPMYSNSALIFGGTIRIDTGYVDTTTQAITVAVGDVVVCAIAGRKLVNLTSVTANGVAMTAPVAHQSALDVTGAVTYYWVANVAGSINVVVASAANSDLKTILVTKIAGLNTTGLIVDSYGVMDFFTANTRTFATNNGDVLVEIFAAQNGGLFTLPAGATALTNADHADVNMGATAVSYIVADSTTETSLITPTAPDNVARVSLVFRRNVVLNYLGKDNVTAYNPTTAYHPATKLYVDEKAGGVYTTVGATSSDHPTDGVADDVQIQAAITAVGAAGGGTVFVKRGNYAIAATINMASNVALLGDNRATTFTFAVGKTLKISGKTNVEVRGIKFDGNAHNINNFGIYVEDSTNVLIAENRFENMTGFAVFIVASAALTCSHVTVRGNYMQGKGNADTIGGGPANSTGAVVSDINIYGNTVIQDLTVAGAGVYQNVFDIVKVQRVSVDNNIFWGRVQFGTEQFPNTNSKFSNNIIRPAIGGTVTALLVTTLGTATSPVDGIGITGNVIQSGTLKVTGIAAHPVKHVTITGNVIKGEAILNGLELTNVTESVVVGNTISNATAGVYLSGCSDFIISGNQISTCTYGIRDITGTASILIGSNSFKAITTAEIVGGTSVLPITKGGTGASDAATARTNLGLGTIATLNSPLPAANVATMTATVGGGVPTPPNIATQYLNGQGVFSTPAGGGTGDMVLATAQTNSGLKTFLNATFGLRNVANTITSVFSNAATVARTWTLKDADGTIAFTSDITGTNSGTNTGDNATNTQYSGLATSKQDTLSLTTTGTTGVATLVGATLNVPQYSSVGVTNLTTTAAPTTVTINSDTGTDAAIAAADVTNAGLLLPAEKTKLTGIATGATANSSDATLLARANHTGTQTAATVSDFSAAADARITAATGVSVASLVTGKIPSSQLPAVGLVTVQTAISQVAHLALTTQEGDVVVRTDENKTYIRNAGVAGTMADFTLLNTPTDAVTSVNGFIGAVVLAKADVGLGNVDNTSDVNKPVSTAQQTAIDLKANIASPTFTGTVTTPNLIVDTLLTVSDISNATTGGLKLGDATLIRSGAGVLRTGAGLITGGVLSVATTDATHTINMAATTARSVGMNRHTTANTVGQVLTVQSGGATVAATDKAAGNLVLRTGLSTGTGAGSVLIQTATPGATGTVDNAVADRLTINSTGATFTVPVIATGGLKILNASTVGQVWTANDTVGNGAWTAAPGGGSGITRTVASIAVNTTAPAVAATDYVYFVSGTTTLTLPTAVGNTNYYEVIHTDASTLTVATTLSQTIAFYPEAPATTATITAQGTVVGFKSDGANWWTI